MDSYIWEEVLDRFFLYEILVLIIFRDLEIKLDVIEKVKKYKRIFLSINRNIIRFINRLLNYLDNKLVLYIIIYGVLVDIYGIGVLIKGESSIGKLEIVLELI